MNRFLRTREEKLRKEYDHKLLNRLERCIHKSHPPVVKTIGSGRSDLDKATRNFFDDFDFTNLSQILWDRSGPEDRRQIVRALRMSPDKHPNLIGDAYDWLYEKVTDLLLEKKIISLPFVLPLPTSTYSLYEINTLVCVKRPEGSLYHLNALLSSGELICWTTHALEQARDRLGLRNCREDIGAWIFLLFTQPVKVTLKGEEFLCQGLRRTTGEVIPVLYFPLERDIIGGKKAHILKTALLPGMHPTEPYIREGRASYEATIDYWRKVWADRTARKAYVTRLRGGKAEEINCFVGF